MMTASPTPVAGNSVDTGRHELPADLSHVAQQLPEASPLDGTTYDNLRIAVGLKGAGQ